MAKKEIKVFPNTFADSLIKQKNFPIYYLKCRLQHNNDFLQLTAADNET